MPFLLMFTSSSGATGDASPSGTGETVLLIGASGAIGQFVTRALEARGCKVRGLTRYPEKAKEQLGASVEWVGGDLLENDVLDDPSFFRKLLAGADRVAPRSASAEIDFRRKNRLPSVSLSALAAKRASWALCELCERAPRRQGAPWRAGGVCGGSARLGEPR